MDRYRLLESISSYGAAQQIEFVGQERGTPGSSSTVHDDYVKKVKKSIANGGLGEHAEVLGYIHTLLGYAMMSKNGTGIGGTVNHTRRNHWTPHYYT